MDQITGSNQGNEGFKTMDDITWVLTTTLQWSYSYNTEEQICLGLPVWLSVS